MTKEPAVVVQELIQRYDKQQEKCVIWLYSFYWKLASIKFYLKFYQAELQEQITDLEIATDGWIGFVRLLK